MFLGAFLAIAFIVLVSLRGIAGFYTDYLWFDSLNLSAVWSRVLTTKATLSLIGGVVFFALCWGNLLIAERLAPVFRPASGDDDLIERYHEMIGRRARLVGVADPDDRLVRARGQMHLSAPGDHKAGHQQQTCGARNPHRRLPVGRSAEFAASG